MTKIIPNYVTVPGQGFTVLDLDLGEIALNISDGTLYLKKETAGVPSVIILAGSGSSVVSSSYALTSSYTSYADVALNATNSLNTLFGIFSLHSYYSQLARTASFAYRADYSEFALKSLTANNASTASLPIRGIITASAAGSTITFTKGDSSTFNVSVTTATAETASYVTSSNVDGPFGKNSILSASYAVTSSLPLQGLITASAAGSTITFTKGDSSTFNVTITTATAETASYVTSSNVDGPFGKNSILSASYAVTASYVLNAVSASYALSASQAVSASYALSSSQAVSSSFALSASFAQTASYAPSSLSASYASTSSNVEGGATNYITLWRTNTALTSSVMYQSGSNITVGGGAVLPSAKLEVKGAGSTSATVALNVINASSTELLYLRNDGFVGIGTASAASTENMYVKKQQTVFNQGADLTNYTIVDVSNTTSVLRLGVETNSGGSILTGTTAYAGIVGNTKNFPLQFITNNTVKATLLGNGNFGLGITSPLYTLDVSGSARITSSVFLPGLTNVSQPHLISFNSSSGQLYYLATSSFTASWANNAVSSSYPFRVTGSNIISYNTSNVSAFNSLAIGQFAGRNTLDVLSAHFIGQYAGDGATYANYSTFIGLEAGYQAVFASYSTFIGAGTGKYASGAQFSAFVGKGAGDSATSAYYSNFIGFEPGVLATDAFNSNFLGYQAGREATNANNSNFIGSSAGYQATSASYSTLLGYQVGYNAAGGALGIKSNNIIIGTNITLADGRQDSINLGGIIFGTGSYSTTTGNPFSGSAGGRIGINQVVPIFNLHVSGTVGFPNLTNVNQANIIAFDTASGQLYYVATSSIQAAPTFPFTGSAVITGSLVVTGSITATLGITGSLFGTASWAFNASQSISSSFATSASYALSASQAQNAVTASYVLNAVSASFASTASFVQNAVSASFASTASFVQNAVSASFAATASSADNFTVRGTLTAQTIVVQTITSSTDFVTGSTRFGTLLSNTHQFTGSVSITGSLNVTGAGITGSLFGTASWANNAITASNALTASFVQNAVSASFATTASYVLNAVSASFATSASQAVTASYVLNAVSASFASTASFVQNAVSASFALTSSLPLRGLITASAAGSTITFTKGDSSTFNITLTTATADTASYVTSSNVDGPFGKNSILSASYAVSSSQAQNAVTASYILNAVSASFASTASFVQNAISASFAATASSADNFTVRGTLTAQTIVAQVITSSTDFVTGSSRFGTLLTNTHQFTGSVSITGSLNVVGAGITGSLFGTASWANNAISSSFASTASFVQNAVSASFATSASQAQNTVTASYITSSGVFGPFGNNSILSASHAVTAAFAANSSGVSGGTVNYIPLWTGTTTLGTSSMFQTSGNINVSGAMSVTGSFTVSPSNITEFQVQSTGVKIGNVVTDIHTVTGSLNVSGSITGSLFGTASWAVSASQAISSAFSQNATSASFASTASFVQNAISASFASTASSADNFTVRNTLTATTIVVQTITSSTDFVTGSSRFGTLLSNTHQFTGSVSMTGSLTVVGAGITGSLFGTSSWAVSASQALTASYVLNAVSSSFASTASYVLNAVSASFASTASFITSSRVFGPYGADSILSASHAVTAAFAANSSGVSGGAANYITMWTSATALSSSIMYQTSSRIGIGVISASNRLDVAVSTANSSNYLTNVNTWALALKNTDDTAGNAVGITFGQGLNSANFNGSPNNTYTNYIVSVRTGTGIDSTGDLVFGGRPAQSADFVERMRITSDGRVIITGSFAVNGSSSNIHTVTGSLRVSGSVTGSLFGTASWANNSLTSSFVTGSNVFGPFGSNSVISASFAVSASQALSSSYALTASFASSTPEISTGTANYIVKYTGTRTLGVTTTPIFEDNSKIAIGRTSAPATQPLQVYGTTGGAVFMSSSVATPVLNLRTSGQSEYGQILGLINAANGNSTINIISAYSGNSITKGIKIDDYIYLDHSGSIPQVRTRGTGSTSFVNFAFNNTGSGFYAVGPTPPTDGSYDFTYDTPSSIYLSFGSTNKFEFSSSGMFRAADDIVAFYSFSDRNLKYDIRQICGSVALDQVQQLQGVYYKWVGDQGSRANREEIGLIAQDVEKVIPQLVREQERLGQGTFKMVDYEHLTALLIEAVKEQQKQIDELKAKIDALTK